MTNVLPFDDAPINPAIWARPATRHALRTRDITTLFQHLQAAGVYQRRIARLTGMNQSDVSEITNGRQVQAYDVLARIADGLGIERGLMGLAYSDSTPQSAPPVGAACHPRDDEDDEMQRRNFLGLISAAVFAGQPQHSVDWDGLAVRSSPTPVPSKVGGDDLLQLVKLTGDLRRSDAEHGGGGCRDAVLTQLDRAELLLKTSVPDELRPEWLSAVADLNTLAGWTAHDLGKGNENEARQYLRNAVLRATEAANPMHTAIALHHLGRVPLDNGNPKDALAYFQLGQKAAEDAGSLLALAIMHADAALAHALSGDARRALDSLGRAEHEFAGHLDRDHEQPTFASFFDAAALNTNAARVYSALGLVDAKHRAVAIERLQAAIRTSAPHRVRQNVFNESQLAACEIAAGDASTGIARGVHALEAAQRLRSPRVLQHLAPLQYQAGRLRSEDGSALAREIKRARIAVEHRL
ncbi:helix-turn-helix domain-containing protein [Allokutzneria sp. A3M-2-11 16]|uniref:helix-turn-helix domain-containing protein n=1 Tax=Allokutzneria sp. A3M-2-11 16 TaxID=2962043 RepID=UPI0020B84DFC|nr:helix-turn-helix transcriptional regulator [Allokutzneria sp. A3M-2-11 16]MCP3802287.1 helix-turn-helix domain-containing protein [Allokutzneria sp. A3M-2-11 16]